MSGTCRPGVPIEPTPRPGSACRQARRFGARPFSRRRPEEVVSGILTTCRSRPRSLGVLRSLGPADFLASPTDGVAGAIASILALARSAAVAVSSREGFLLKCHGTRSRSTPTVARELLPRESSPAACIGPGRFDTRTLAGEGEPQRTSPTRSLQLTSVSPRHAVGAEPR
jgi:hypothetical protein